MKRKFKLSVYHKKESAVLLFTQHEDDCAGKSEQFLLKKIRRKNVKETFGPGYKAVPKNLV